MKYLGLAILISILISLSGIIFVGLVMGSFYIKKIVHKMDEEKWDLYFKSLSENSYLIRFWTLYTTSLVIVSFIGEFLFNLLGYDNPKVLSMITILLGIMYMAYKFNQNKAKLFDKIIEIRSH